MAINQALRIALYKQYAPMAVTLTDYHLQINYK
jgi:hypothetical protein